MLALNEAWRLSLRFPLSIVPYEPLSEKKWNSVYQAELDHEFNQCKQMKSPRYVSKIEAILKIITQDILIRWAD